MQTPLHNSRLLAAFFLSLFSRPRVRSLSVALIGPLLLALFSQHVQAQSQTFNCTNGEQTYIVPNNVTSLLVTVKGAAGGMGVGTPGNGGTVSSRLAVTPGTTLYLYVGCKPDGLTGGFNGGGTAKDNDTRFTFSAGGGGASDIRIGGTGLDNRVIVAGGGGGSGDGRGGNGGGLTGANGMNDTRFFQYTGGGSGGTQSAGGKGGVYTQASGIDEIKNVINGMDGEKGQGGGAESNTSAGAGGGGGGYYGGGGGASGGSRDGATTFENGGGGGGGSSYTDNLVNTQVESIQGNNEGEGSIEIVACVATTQFAVTGGGSYCSGTGGVPVGLTGSETGVTYRLLLNGAPTGGAASQGNGSVISFGNQTAVGTYTVEASRVGGLCSTTVAMMGSATVAVNPAVVTAISANPGFTICANTSTTLTASDRNSGGALAFQWANGGPAGAVYGVSPLTNTPYSVTITNTSTGCRSETSVTVTVNPLPANPSLAVSGIITCAQPAVTLTAGTSSGGSFNYAFAGPVGGPSGVVAQAGTSATVNAAGVYSVTITNQATGCSSSTTTSVFNDTALPTVTLLFSNGTQVAVNGTPTITVPSGTGNQFLATNGVSYEYISLLDRVNGYEIRHKDFNTTGLFTIERLGPFSVIVTGRNGCSRTVQGILANP